MNFAFLCAEHFCIPINILEFYSGLQLLGKSLVIPSLHCLQDLLGRAYQNHCPLNYRYLV